MEYEICDSRHGLQIRDIGRSISCFPQISADNKEQKILELKVPTLLSLLPTHC